MYGKNKKLFEGEHVKVYAEQFKRIERVIGNFQEVISYTFVANYQKLLSLKVADLLLGEAPKITAGDAGSAEQQRVEEIVDNSDLVNTGYETAIDISRFGDGILQVYEDNGQNLIGVITPEIWFPVVDPGNLKRVLHQVLAWKETVGKDEFLNIRIHSKGSYEERRHSLKDGKIGEETQAPVTRQTELSDCAIIPIHNLITSDRATGFDDYTDVDSIIAELLVRVAQVAKVLDKFSQPGMSGPQSALEKNPETGEWQVKFGNFFARNSNDDPEVKPIVWDASMDANFKMIERLINTLYQISEVGSLIFTDMLAKAGDITGPGMKRVHQAALAKVNRIKMRLDPGLRKAIALSSERGGGTKLERKQINVGWNDGLPDDELEQAQTLSTLYGAGLISLEGALKKRGLEGEALQAEMERIKGEQQPTYTPTNPKVTLEAAAAGGEGA